MLFKVLKPTLKIEEQTIPGKSLRKEAKPSNTYSVTVVGLLCSVFTSQPRFKLKKYKGKGYCTDLPFA